MTTTSLPEIFKKMTIKPILLAENSKKNLNRVHALIFLNFLDRFDMHKCSQIN